MEVMVGPAFTIDVPSSPPHVVVPPEYDDGDRPTSDDGAVEPEPSTSLVEDGSGFRDGGGQSGFFAGDDSSESSSSIGTPDNSDDENGDVSSHNEEDEEVQSKLKGLSSLESLEDSLPIKRGLSSHFAGKSKSFTDLSQVSSVKELQKTENPLNKRRRVQIASKWSRRSSFYAYSNPKSMPLLPLDEDPESEEEEEQEKEANKEAPSSSSAEKKKNRVPQSYAEHMRLRLGNFQSRSLSLADLQERDEDEEEEEEEEEEDDDD